MAIPVDEMETLRAELLRNRARGVRTVMYDGKRVEYGTDAEMARAMADLDARIARARQRPANTIRFVTSKGV